jgi:caspase domain-containing protein
MSDFHALLIGIDAYLPNRLPNGGSFPPLGGCVRDVQRVERYLAEELHVPAERIAKLTATLPAEPAPVLRDGNPAGTHPVEPPEEWPTYTNIVSAFKKLTAEAKEGDEVFIHYSGHGGRTPTVFPQKKGRDGHDETLVPVDIGDPKVRYIRDLDLAYLLKVMVDKKIRVTVVLDCCHAGGAARREVFPRGMQVPFDCPPIDRTERPEDSLLAQQEDLLASWSGEPPPPGAVNGLTFLPGYRGALGASRNVAASTGWLPKAEGYSLLAACTPQESAYESVFDEQEGRSGALTHWLLDTLYRRWPGMTYDDLCQRILAGVHGQLLQQTPMLLGEGDRQVFGADRVPRRQAVAVMTVDPDGRRLLLHTGQSQGIRKGARFAVYPLQPNGQNGRERSAVVKITECGATDSWAQVIEAPSAPIESGYQAQLIDPGSVELQGAIRLLPPGPAAERVCAEIGQQIAAEPFLRLVPEGSPDDPEELQVTANEQGEIEIRDGSGKPVPNLNPALRIDEPGCADSVVARLVHLTKYRMVDQLHNFNESSPLAGKLAAGLFTLSEDYDPGFRPKPRPDDTARPVLDAVEGDWVLVQIANRSSYTLHVAVLDLQPDWGITRVLPGRGEGAFLSFDPGQVHPLPLRVSLPEGIEEAADKLKVFATRGTSDFGWLTLPALGEPPEPGDALRSAGSPLEELFAAFRSNQPRMRNLIPSSFPSEEWVTAEVEVRIRRPPH